MDRLTRIADSLMVWSLVILRVLLAICVVGAILGDHCPALVDFLSRGR